MPSIDPIRAYYDRNTGLFLRFGSSKQVQTIHRALWPKGVTSLSQALQVVNEWILLEAQSIPEPILIADLGCGVGASLLHLLANLAPNARGIGLTISKIQAQLGREIFRARSLAGHVIEADFQHLPLTGGFDLAYAIESFVHTTDPELFMAEAARILHGPLDGKPGARLIVVDDFSGIEAEGSGNKFLDSYLRGWQIHNLISPAEMVNLAARHGFRLLQNRFLSPYLRLRTGPNLVTLLAIKLISPLWKIHPIVPSMLGSAALQKCLQLGCVEYHWFVFERE